MLRIVIDPGHGGDDPGAVNPRGVLTEADFNWRCAQIVGMACRLHGWTVHFTRQEDENPHEGDSAGFANSIGADYFISLHANAGPPSAHGAEVLYFYSSGRGKKLAQLVLDDYVQRTGFRNRGIKARYPRSYPGREAHEYRGSVVLGNTIMPAILVEAGFISNDEEYAKLFQMQTMGAVADSVVHGIIQMEQGD